MTIKSCARVGGVVVMFGAIVLLGTSLKPQRAQAYDEDTSSGIKIGSSLASADDGSGCTNATITGSYGGLLTGTIIGLGPIGQVDIATFDGAGHWSRTETTNINGNTLPPETIAGTYNVNADCTGSTQDEQGHASTFVLVNHGKEMLALVTDHGVVLTVDLKKE
jgi:hypothetical protein